MLKNIPVKVNPLFILMVCLIGWLHTGQVIGMLLWGFVITVSILAHEYGHALTACFFGQTSAIELMALGGLTSHTGKKKLALWKEFLIVLNGPLVGFFLGIVSYFLIYSFYGQSDGDQDLLKNILVISVVVNLFWTAVNVLPLTPLDGGHLLRIGLEALLGVKGIKIAALLSFFFSVAAAGVFFLYNLMVPGILFIFFATDNWRNWELVKGISASDKDEKFQQQFEKGKKMLALGHSSLALEELQAVRHGAKSGLLYRKASEEMAKIHAEHAEFNHVYELLLPLQVELEGVMRYLLFSAAYHEKHWQTVKQMGDELFREFPEEKTAWMNAAAHAALKEVDAAVGWLRCAANEGASMQDLMQRVKDGNRFGSCFDPIRSEEAFVQWQREG